MTKIAIALSLALVLDAASTVSAQYDPWISPDVSFATTVDAGHNALASSGTSFPDPLFDDPMGGAIW